jgi:hypothetical protein
MQHSSTSLILAAILALGFVEASSASVCAVSDVTLDGMDANSCGTGDPNGAIPPSLANTPVNDPQLPDDYTGWDVNLNSDGGRNDWQFFYKQDLNSEVDPFGTTTPDISSGADLINLQITSTGGNDNWSSGAFSVNAYDPLLIVMGDGIEYEYTWYLFTGKTGTLNGTWDTNPVFGGKDLSNLTAYAISGDGLEPPAAIPVPAAVWLFGSGLLGLLGVARRRKV